MKFFERLPQDLLVERLGILLGCISFLTGSITSLLIVTRFDKLWGNFISRLVHYRVRILDDLWFIFFTSIAVFVVSLALIFMGKKLVTLWNWLKGK